MTAARGWRPAALVLAVLAAGCVTQQKRIYNLNTYAPDPPTYLFSGASASRAVPTYVVNNPFGGSPEAVANVVAAALQSAFPTRDVRFAVRPEEGLRDDVAMVVAFDPPGGTSPKQVCRTPGRIGFAPSGTAVRTMMTFCYGARALTSIEGRLDRRAGIGDKEFVALVRDMAKRMFEARHEYKL
jgi:hypothetical protein